MASAGSGAKAHTFSIATLYSSSLRLFSHFTGPMFGERRIRNVECFNPIYPFKCDK